MKNVNKNFVLAWCEKTGHTLKDLSYKYPDRKGMVLGIVDSEGKIICTYSNYSELAKFCLKWNPPDT